MQRSPKLFVALIFFLATLAPQVWSQSKARIVRISDVEGQVDFDNGHGYDTATINIPVTEGNRMFTREDGWAEIEFEDGSTLRMAPETEIVFSELKLSQEGGTITAIDLNSGEAEFNLAYHDLGSFQVNVHQKAVILQESGRFRIGTSNSNPLELVVWKGKVSVNDPGSGEKAFVQKNETFALDPVDVARYDLEDEAVGDDLDGWSDRRDQYLSQYANESQQAPYRYGMGDLYQYGQYYYVAGYGEMWRPNDVSFDWDPFLNGYWCPTAHGYMWVSAYPWGWMPYRYGQWVFIAGQGWLWQPGAWHHWHTTPQFVHGPVQFHPPAFPPAGVKPRRIAPIPGPVQPPVRVANDNPWRNRIVRDHKRVITDDDIDAIHRANRPVADKSDSPRFERPTPDDDKLAQQPIHKPDKSDSPRFERIDNENPTPQPVRAPDRSNSPRFERPTVDNEKPISQPSHTADKSSSPRLERPVVDNEKPAPKSAPTPDRSSSPRFEHQSTEDAKPPSPAPSSPPRSYSPPPPAPPASSSHSAPEHSSPPAHAESHAETRSTSTNNSAGSGGGASPKRQ